MKSLCEKSSEEWGTSVEEATREQLCSSEQAVVKFQTDGQVSLKPQLIRQSGRNKTNLEESVSTGL